MKSLCFGIIMLLSCLAIATTGQAQDIPGTAEFNFGQLTVDDDSFQLLIAVSVPVTRTVEFTIQVPVQEEYIDQNGAKAVRTRFVEETGTRELTEVETVMQTLLVTEETFRFQTIGGTKVPFSDLARHDSKPVLVFNTETTIGDFHKQVFTGNTLVAFPIPDKLR